MTRSAIPALVLAGLATTLHAQTVGTVTLTASATTVNVGDTFTVGVALSDNIEIGSVYAFDVRVSGSGAAFSTIPGSYVGDPSGSGNMLGLSSQINPDGAAGSGASNDVLGPSLDAPLDDLTVYTFQVLATQGGVITFQASDGGLFDGVDGVAFSAQCVVICPFAYDEVVFISTSVTVVPTPPSAISLSLATPLATRRRR